MTLGQVIDKSVYGTIGYIGSEQDLADLNEAISFNLPVLKKYKQIVVATNFDSNSSFVKQNSQLWKNYFPDCILLNSTHNRGHSFGTADLDNMLFDYCKHNNIKWLCKSTNDVIFKESILNIKVPEVDFYYLNGIGWTGMELYDYDFNRIKKEYFYPQTNFYFINTSKVDYLNDKQYLDDTYKKTRTIKNYSNRPWEYFKKWSCEDFLKNCVTRNKLSKHHLISPEMYDKLLFYVKNFYVSDPSHKNLMIEGISHIGVPTDPITELI